MCGNQNLPLSTKQQNAWCMSDRVSVFHQSSRSVPRTHKANRAPQKSWCKQARGAAGCWDRPGCTTCTCVLSDINGLAAAEGTHAISRLPSDVSCERGFWPLKIKNRASGWAVASHIPSRTLLPRSARPYCVKAGPLFACVESSERKYCESQEKENL